MSTPLYQLKAEFFKTLGHPARIRVLELLSEREYAVAEMLPEVGIEPAHLSQQLAVLRGRAGAARAAPATRSHTAIMRPVRRIRRTSRRPCRAHRAGPLSGSRSSAR